MSLLFLLFICFIRLVRTELVYIEPVYQLSNPNFTLGGLFTITQNSTSVISTDGVDQSLAMMCTLKEFNEGRGPFNVTGTFNGLIYDAGGTVRQSEYSAMRLLEYNLKESTNTREKSSDDIKVGAIIADLDKDIFFATQPIFAGFPLTFLGVQFLSSGIGSNNTLLPNPVFKARIVPQSFVISAASSSSMAMAIVEMLLHFNWTLVTVIYSSDTFGMEGQAFLQPILQQNSILTTCSIITKPADNADETQISALADCLNRSDVRVVILWSGLDSKVLVQISRSLQSKVDFKLTFITPGSDSSSYVNSDFLQELSSSFLFKNVNLVPFTDSFKSCLEGIQPSTQEYFESSLFEKYWQQKFKCPPNDEDCLTQSIITKSIDTNQVADSTMLILKSINLMQSNCSTINFLLNSYNLNLKNKDYCEKDEFTASDIYQIVNLVLYLGLPEFLTLGTNYTGSAHSLQIIQLNQTGKLVPVGKYDNEVLVIDDSLLYWQNNQVPVSEVSVDNPTFDDAIVTVFFAFDILALLVSFSIKICFIYFRNDRIIRKSSPWISFMILLGIDLVLIGFIFYGMTYTTTTCFLFAWLLTIGCGLCLASIFLKSYRIFKIFKNAEATAVSISDKDLFYFTGAVIAIELILLSIYSFVSGILGPEVIQSSSDIYYKYRICLVPSDAIQICFTILIYSFNALILFSVALLAFLTRKIDNSYSEARSIAYAVYCTILFQVIFLPLVYTASNSTGSAITRYAVTGIIILCTCNMIIIFLFGEKVYELIKSKIKRE